MMYINSSCYHRTTKYIQISDKLITYLTSKNSIQAAIQNHIRTTFKTKLMSLINSTLNNIKKY